MLQSPTTKDYTNVMQFLLRELDPSSGRSGAPLKLEEEVPALFKRLRYPLQISRASLAAVGSPHTWPSVLAATAWLVDLLRYSARAEAARLAPPTTPPVDDPEDVDGARSRAEAAFFEYVSASYRAFMAGDDAACEAADGEKAAEFERKASELREETERAEAATARLASELDERATRPSALEAAIARRDETARDKDRFLELIAALESRVAAAEARERDRRGDVESKRVELAAVEREREQLRATVAAQDLTPADVARMAHDRAAAEARLRAASAQREALANKVARLEAELEGALDRAEASLAKYRVETEQLRLVPAGAKRADGVSYEVRLDRRGGGTGPDAPPLVDADLKGVLKPAAEALAERYAARARELRQELVDLADKRAAANEVLRERLADQAAAKEELEAAEADREAAREELERSLTAVRDQAERLAADCDALRHGDSTGEAEAAAELDRLEEALDKERRLGEAENGALHRDLSAALEAILNHKVHCQRKLQSALKTLKDVRETTAADAQRLERQAEGWLAACESAKKQREAQTA